MSILYKIQHSEKLLEGEVELRNEAHNIFILNPAFTDQTQV